jgi:hypothetical protein
LINLYTIGNDILCSQCQNCCKTSIALPNCMELLR